MYFAVNAAGLLSLSGLNDKWS